MMTFGFRSISPGPGCARAVDPDQPGTGAPGAETPARVLRVVDVCVYCGHATPEHACKRYFDEVLVPYALTRAGVPKSVEDFVTS